MLVNTDIRSGADPSRHPLNVLYSERFVKSVFAHELVHGMQFAAHARFGDAPRTFFSENSATYHGADFFGLFESTAPKDAAVLAYLLALVLREPGTSLHADTNGREYVPIWSKYLVDSRGGDRTILRRIYEELDRDPQGGLFGATDRVLRASGGSLEEDYQQYAEWNYKVGPYADGSGYPEAARFETNWGSVNVQAGHGAPPIEASSSLRGLPSLASYYIRFRPGPTTTDGVFRLGGLPGFRWGVSVLARDAETGVYAVVRDRSGPLNGKIDLVLRDWNAADDLVAIVSNLTVRDQPGDAAGLFSYRIEALPAD